MSHNQENNQENNHNQQLTDEEQQYLATNATMSTANHYQIQNLQ